MTEKTREQISTLIDDELSASERTGLLKQLKQTPELGETWARYHLIGDAIRGESVQADILGIAQRVSAQIADEPAIIAAPRPGERSSGKDKGQRVHWMRPSIGVALAASVAGAAIMVLPDFSTNLVDTPDTAPVQVAETAPPLFMPEPDALQLISAAEAPHSYSPSSGMHWKNLSQPETVSRLNRYLIDHNELASPAAGMTGVLPYASFVSYDSKKK